MPEQNIASTLIAMERAALDRSIQGDPGGFLEISAPDVTYFDPFLPKRLDGLDALRALYERVAEDLRAASYELIDPRVQVAGDTAVLTYNYVSGGTGWNCTEVYTLTTEGWRIIHTHWSLTQPRLAT